MIYCTLPWLVSLTNESCEILNPISIYAQNSTKQYMSVNCEWNHHRTAH